MKTLVLAALLAVGLAAQQTQPPVFRSSADIVEVDAVVRDKNGRFVEDLKPEDFEVREEGQPEKIDLFYVVGASTPSPTTAPAVPDAAAASPVVAAPPRAPRVFVVVFDDDHLTPGGFKRIQAAALTLFAKDFQDGDIGGVLTRGQIANKRLTSNREELIAAVKSAKPSGKANSKVFDLREWPSMNDAEAFQISRLGPQNDDVLNEVVQRACADDPDACRRVSVVPVVYEKAQRMTSEIRVSSDQTLRTLAALMHGLEGLNGRKTLLLLSEGFVADESWPLVQEAVGLAARANARIYSLDARGLNKGRQPIGNYAPHDDALGNLLASFDIGADPMNSLAADTGGFVIQNTNIMDQAIDRIVDDASHYYVLGYRPEAAADGKFRKISVKVKRQGVSVRARSGYVATPKAAVTATVATHPSAAPPATAPNEPPSGGSEKSQPTGDVAGSEKTQPMSDVAEPRAATASARANAPSGSEAAVVSPATPSALTTLHIRPDASKHVESLAGGAADTDATAGWSAYQRGDLESARTALAAAAARPGARPWVQYALGQSQYALRDYTSAVASWEHVRTSAPDFEPVYFDLVDGYIQVKDPDKAIRVLREAKHRWAKDSEVHNALGVVLAARGSLDDAVQSFSEAVAVAPHEAVGYFNLARTLELRYRRNAQRTRGSRLLMSTADRDKAITNYTRYLEIGGPLADTAREGLARLGWQ